ncbi:MAG: hypothetical protein LBE38_08695 [Deltaproteobacteria bacterium]|nr:hypothetical protein [Deltaproteobacteria bacterium]
MLKRCKRFFQERININLWRDLWKIFSRSLCAKRTPLASYPMAIRVWGGNEKELLRQMLPRCTLFLIMGLSFSLALYLEGYRVLCLIVMVPALLGALESLWKRKVLKDKSFISFKDYLLSLLGIKKALR